MIIALEGTDQAGKKTQTAMLAKALKAQKIKTAVFDFPDYSTVIGKKIRLPITVKEGEEKVNSAKYADGVLTIEIPITKKGKEISLD